MELLGRDAGKEAAGGERPLGSSPISSAKRQRAGRSGSVQCAGAARRTCAAAWRAAQLRGGLLRHLLRRLRGAERLGIRQAVAQLLVGRSQLALLVRTSGPRTVWTANCLDRERREVARIARTRTRACLVSRWFAALRAVRGPKGSGVTSRYALIIASTSSRFACISSGEATDSRFRRIRGSVFEPRTLKCQLS